MTCARRLLWWHLACSTRQQAGGVGMPLACEGLPRRVGCFSGFTGPMWPTCRTIAGSPKLLVASASRLSCCRHCSSRCAAVAPHRIASGFAIKASGRKLPGRTAAHTATAPCIRAGAVSGWRTSVRPRCQSTACVHVSKGIHTFLHGAVAHKRLLVLLQIRLRHTGRRAVDR